MKRGATKNLRVCCSLLAIFLCFAFVLLPQPVQAQTVTTAVTVGSAPVSAAVTPNGEYVYVTNGGSSKVNGTVSVINTATNTVTTTINVGSYPVGVAVTPNGEYAYVTNNGGDTVSVISTGAPTVSVSPSSWTMNVGQSTMFTATASGGSGSYTSYQWYVDDVVQSGQTASTFSYSPASSGTDSITATVTDSSGATSVQSAASSVTVRASGTRFVFSAVDWSIVIIVIVIALLLIVPAMHRRNKKTQQTKQRNSTPNIPIFNCF